MLDIEQMVRAGAESAGTSRIILAACYDLSARLCHDLADRRLIDGYISNNASSLGNPSDPLVRGRWVDRDAGRWRIDAQGCPTVLFLGSEHQVSGRMLLEAQRSGVRNILVVHNDGTISANIDVRVNLISRATTALVRGFLKSSIVRRGALKSINSIINLSFDKAFELIYTLLRDRLRLPKSEFIPGRVLLISGSLGPGGAERQIAYTAAGIMKRNEYKVFVGCNYLDPPGDFFRAHIEDAGAKVLPVPFDVPEFRSPEMIALRQGLVPYDPVGMQNLLFTVFHYALLIHSVKPAIVHTWMDSCNVLAGIAADIVGVPALVQSGRSVAPDNFSIFQPFMRPGYLKLLGRRPTIFLNNSRAGAEDYARWLGVCPERFRVIHNGFEFPRDVSRDTAIAERLRLGIPPNAFVVGSIIRYSEEKRPKLLIDMGRILLSHHQDIKLVFFGAGPMLDEMRSYIHSQKLSNSIILPGFTNDAWSSLAAMDVFVLASRMEGLPNVLIEAQGCGLPIVCTAVGGMSETYIEGETGFGVRSGTPEDLAEAVSRLVRDPHLHKKMAEKAFRHARDNFGLDQMVSQTLAAYHDAEKLDSPSGAKVNQRTLR